MTQESELIIKQINDIKDNAILARKSAFRNKLSKILTQSYKITEIDKQINIEPDKVNSINNTILQSPDGDLTNYIATNAKFKKVEDDPADIALKIGKKTMCIYNTLTDYDSYAQYGKTSDIYPKIDYQSIADGLTSDIINDTFI